MPPMIPYPGGSVMVPVMAGAMNGPLVRYVLCYPAGQNWVYLSGPPPGPHEYIQPVSMYPTQVLVGPNGTFTQMMTANGIVAANPTGALPPPVYPSGAQPTQPIAQKQHGM